ncbi:hypothetical protein GCM10010112_68060 [Actinoplanes lobatus]|uniref:Uncharacterized protein n=1 Tax=Actinoplanes lobatus TaxID=113568 RepID=A0A7W7HEK0_9ACTN|nr:hypothetical protein [Actinoplanes lobatus]MBB4749113.1 hypothetical protein [Actinoplanes lobatus]GGN86449.1 hypothetical protein GCM10010112_68060 [Actinoplanes lobatus]GIE42788.1 hypothetical protein Alo02nite_56860 [Actinoplanes lobatus]
MSLPRSGDLVHITRAASVQFVYPFLFRIIRVHNWPTYEGWVWLDGYELGSDGNAVERRSIFVQIAGLRHSVADRARNGGPVNGRQRAPGPRQSPASPSTPKRQTQP